MIQWKDYIRPAACASVSLLALSIAAPAQAQQYQRAPSVEVNLQALQALRFSTEESKRFAVSAPQKVEQGSIQATKLYPPGYTGKREAPKAHSRTGKVAPAPVKRVVAQAPVKKAVAPVASAPVIAPAQPKQPVRQAQSGYVPPVASYVPMPNQGAKGREARKIPPQNIAQAEVRKTPELNKTMQAPKVRVQAPVPVYATPEKTAPVVAREVAAAPVRATVAPKPAPKMNTAKSVLHDMMDMPAKARLPEVKAPVVTAPVAKPVAPEVPKAAPLPPAEKPKLVAKAAPKPTPKPEPQKTPPAPIPAVEVKKKPVSVASPVIYDKKLLPAIKPEEVKEPGVELPEAVLESLQPMDSDHPIVKAESKVTRKKLFDAPPKKEELAKAEKVVSEAAARVETDLDAADIEIPSFDELPEMDFDVPESTVEAELPAPVTQPDVVAAPEQPNYVVPEYPAAPAMPEPQTPDEPTPEELIATLPDFEALDPTPKSDLPPLPMFDDSVQPKVGDAPTVAPESALPSLDALTQEEEVVFEPIDMADFEEVSPEKVEVEVKAVAQPAPVEGASKKAESMENTVPDLPEVEDVVVQKAVEVPVPENTLEMPGLPSFEPVPEPVNKAVVNEASAPAVQEMPKGGAEEVNELLPDFELPEPPAAPMELAALPDLNEVAPKLPEASKAVPAAAQITFGKGEKTVEQGLEQRIMQVAEEAKAGQKNIQVIAYASGGPEEASTARRISLARALDIRALLIQNGISEDRISLQALGNREANSEDRADIFLK